jgi:hypothetical protein
MTDDERLIALLREALPDVSTAAPSRDLWPAIAGRRQRPVGWSWVDLGIAAGVCGAFLWQPKWFVWLSYHF